MTVDEIIVNIKTGNFITSLEIVKEKGIKSMPIMTTIFQSRDINYEINDEVTYIGKLGINLTTLKQLFKYHKQPAKPRISNEFHRRRVS